MKKKINRVNNQVFNNEIGDPYSFGLPQYSSQKSQEILAGLFEQLLIFDHITITTNRLNFALIFLIKELGINMVEQLIDRGFIRFMIWTPVIVTSEGRQMADGSIDISAVIGQPPITAGSIHNDDLDPERNIDKALSQFQLHRDRKRIFTRKAINVYTVPNGMEFSTNAANFIINAYQNNNLANLGLPYDKEPNQMEVDERKLLLELGHKVLETAILAKYSLKSYENYEHFEICKQNLANIGKAYNVSTNTSNILHFENVPNLRRLFLEEKLDFEDVMDVRYLSTAKYYRNWINNIGESGDSKEVTEAYINEIKGKGRFFQTKGGKLLKNLSMMGASSALGAAIAGPVGAVIGAAAVSPAVDISLGFLDEIWLGDLLNGKNPSMFVEDLREGIKKKNEET